MGHEPANENALAMAGEMFTEIKVLLGKRPNLNQAILRECVLELQSEVDRRMSMESHHEPTIAMIEYVMYKIDPSVARPESIRLPYFHEIARLALSELYEERRRELSSGSRS